jgi:hypothetical protein
VRVGADAATNARGYFTRTVDAPRGTRFRVWVPTLEEYGPVVTVS